MQRKGSNGTSDRMIAESIALFVRNEAALLVQVAETQKVLAAGERQRIETKAESDSRFARIEGDLDQIKSILRQLAAAVERHEQILTGLPEAIRQKIGFKPKA